MNISQKCQYGLRAIFELAKRQGQGPTTVGQIAEAQAIPPRFLELILGQLRQGGFVESRRGIHGGYLLAVSSEPLSIGEIIRFIDGPLAPVRCIVGDKKRDCPLYGGCAFLSTWKRAEDAVAKVYDETTFEDLMNEERTASDKYVASYCI